MHAFCIVTNLELHNSRSEVKKRRDLVAALHARSMTETEIEQRLKAIGYSVDQSTISRDLSAIREQVAADWIFDLARSDLAYYFKTSLDTIDEVKLECWNIYKNNVKDDTPIRDRLAPLTLIKECAESRHKLLSDSPSVMAIQALSERLENIEQDFKENNR